MTRAPEETATAMPEPGTSDAGLGHGVVGGAPAWILTHLDPSA